MNIYSRYFFCPPSFLAQERNLRFCGNNLPVTNSSNTGDIAKVYSKNKYLMQALRIFFRDEGLAFVLGGSKPLSHLVIPNASGGQPLITGEHALSSLLCNGDQKTTPIAALLCQDKKYNTLVVINKKQTLETIKTNLNLFNCRLGMFDSATRLLNALSNSDAVSLTDPENAFRTIVEHYQLFKYPADMSQSTEKLMQKLVERALCIKNENRTRNIIQHHLGPSEHGEAPYTADTILKKMLENKSFLQELLKDALLSGILLGYGTQNAYLFERRNILLMDRARMAILEKEFLSTGKPNDYIKQDALNPELFQKHFLALPDSEGIPSCGYQSLQQELDALDDSLAYHNEYTVRYKDNQPVLIYVYEPGHDAKAQIVHFPFALHKDRSAETATLIGQYEGEARKLQQVFEYEDLELLNWVLSRVKGEANLAFVA